MFFRGVGIPPNSNVVLISEMRQLASHFNLPRDEVPESTRATENDRHCIQNDIYIYIYMMIIYDKYNDI